MNIKRRFLSAIMSAVILTSSCAINVSAEDKLPAFPGAEGGGMYTQGARAAASYEIYHVTNLNDSGAGSFRDAVSKDGRIIVFDVAGTINIKSELKIRKSNLTILGQTAPGGGVCISGESVSFRGCDNVIVRYLRFRMGDNSVSQEDALGGTGCSNMIIDHCSVSWSVDECFSFYGNTNFTAQWNLISESLRQSEHSKGAHGYGGIWGGTNASFHHNLLASHDSRNPRIGTTQTLSAALPDNETTVDVRNNVIYNWKQNAGYGGENGVRVNFVNNYFKPTENSAKRDFYTLYGGDTTYITGAEEQSTTLHVSGNVMEGSPVLTENNWQGVHVHSSESNVYWIKREDIDGEGVVMKDNVLVTDAALSEEIGLNSQYLADYPVVTQTAEQAYTDVVKYAGAVLYRDTLDERVVNDVINGTYPTGSNGSVGFVDVPADSGGLPVLYGAKQQDSDDDGIPDEWEDGHSLDKNDASDAVKISATGYTNIEDYANDLVAVTFDFTTLDRNELGRTVSKASQMQEDEYDPEKYAVLKEIYDRAVVILNESREQAEIDNAAAELNKALDNMEILYKNVLKKYISEIREMDMQPYVKKSVDELFALVEKAENDILTTDDNLLFKADYEQLQAGVAALEVSIYPQLDEKLSMAERRLGYYETEHTYTYDSYIVLKNLVDEIKAEYDYSQTNEQYTQWITDIDNAISGLEISILDRLVRFVDNGLKADASLFDSSYPSLLAELEKAKTIAEDETTSNQTVMDTIYSLSTLFKNAQMKISDKKQVYLQDYEGEVTNADIAEIDGNHVNVISNDTTFTYPFPNNGGIYYISTDFMNEEGANQGVQCFELENGTQIYIRNSGNRMEVFEKSSYGTGNTKEWNYGSYNLNTDGWNNLTTVYNTESGLVSIYTNNILISQRRVSSPISRFFRSSSNLYLSQSHGSIYVDNDIIYFDTDREETSTETTTESTTETTTQTTTVTTTETTTCRTTEYAVDGGNLYFNLDTGEIIGSDKKVVNAVIPESINGVTVKGIGKSAFYERYLLKSVSLPETIKYIDGWAFVGCVGLREIALPNSLEMIGVDSFLMCTGLKTMTIPPYVKEIHGQFPDRLETVYVIKGSVADDIYLYGNDTQVLYYDIPEAIYGDADNNGVLTAADSTMILQKVLDSNFEMPLEKAVNDYMSYVDLDNNDTLTAFDAAIVLKKVLGEV